MYIYIYKYTYIHFFLGDAINRNKVNLIIANEITPHLTAEEYMDKGEYKMSCICVYVYVCIYIYMYMYTK
jgi:hypothetical protein